MLGFKPSTLEPVKDGLAERWRDKLVGEVTVDDMDGVLHEIRTKGTPGLRTAHAVSDCAARVALWRLTDFSPGAVERDLRRQPMLRRRRPPSGSARERVLTDDEMRWLWRAAGDLGEPIWASAAPLTLDRTAARRGRWNAVGRAERRPEHLDSARLTHQEWARPCCAIARSAGTDRQRPRIAGPFVFTTDGETHAAGWSKIKLRLDAKMADLARAEKATIPLWVTHDLRRHLRHRSPAARSGLALGKWRALLKERGAFHGQAAATVREGICGRSRSVG